MKKIISFEIIKSETKTTTRCVSMPFTERFSLYKIDDIHNIPFDTIAYSKYKYGDHSIAQKFGEELGNAFITQNSNHLLATKEQFVCISSPFGYVAPAA
ncbi:unnamed protein product, partial [Didymodactylos carnosus]